MNKQKKEMTPIKAERIRLFTFSIMHIYTVLFSYTYFNFLNDYFINGLWHKIISTSWFNIPIGFISGITLSVIFAFIVALYIMFNYRVFKFGLNYIHIEGEK
jgi:hypothetical protein